MKKRFWILAAIGILVVALATPAALGAVDGSGQEARGQQFFGQMFDWHQQWLDQARKDGQITPEQGQAWQDHFNYMRDFHNKYGFGAMGPMMGGCFGGGYGGMMGGSYQNGNMMGR